MAGGCRISEIWFLFKHCLMKCLGSPTVFLQLAQLENEPNNGKLRERLTRLECIITIQKQMALEANSLKHQFHDKALN